MYYRYNTKAGAFKIVPEKNGHWQAMFEDEGLGSYAKPEQAAEDLAGGHTFWPSCGDPSEFRLPTELAEWVAVRNS